MAAARKSPEPSSEEEERLFQEAMRDAGITEKGIPLGRIMWRLASDFYVEAGKMGYLEGKDTFDKSRNIFELREFAERVFRAKAGTMDLQRRRAEIAESERSSRRKKS